MCAVCVRSGRGAGGRRVLEKQSTQNCKLYYLTEDGIMVEELITFDRD